MKLEDYPDKVLVAIMHNSDEEVNEHIKEILDSRMQKRDYHELYIRYISSDKDEKKLLAEALAVHLSNDLYFCEDDIFLDILNYLDIDYVWMLAVSSKNKERRSIAKEKLYSMIDETFMENNKGLKRIKINKRNERKR